MKPLKQLFVDFIKNESGATAIEYGLIAALVALALVVGAKQLGIKLTHMFNCTTLAIRSDGEDRNRLCVRFGWVPT